MAKDTASGSDNAHWSACMDRVAQQRDRESFLALYDHFAPRLNSYLLGQGVDSATAEDLAQEAMLALWNKAHMYHAKKAAVSTWLFRIARNLWIDRLRRNRGMAYELDEEVADWESDDNPEHGGGEAVDAERVRGMLEQLPQQQAQVVYKSYFEGKSHSEIAAETGMPLGSVKSSLRLALNAFRQALGEAT